MQYTVFGISNKTGKIQSSVLVDLQAKLPLLSEHRSVNNPLHVEFSTMYQLMTSNLLQEA